MGAETKAAFGVASVLIAGWAEGQKGIAEARRIRANNKARIKQMKEQYNFNAQNLHNNNVEIKETKMRNDIRIQESKLESQDAFSQAFAGSGVSGRTHDLMAAEIETAVAKSHVESKRIATKEGDRQFLGLMRSGQAQQQQISELETFDLDAMESNMNMAMLQAGINAAGSMAG